MSSDKLDALIRRQWKELGFYYEYDDDSACWIFVGSIAGLESLCNILREYSQNPRNVRISEHDHLGPYMYLEIITWTSPDVTEHGIYGALEDFQVLAGLIEKNLKQYGPCEEFIIWKEYSPASKSRLIFRVQADGFDPSSMDGSLKRDESERS